MQIDNFVNSDVASLAMPRVTLKDVAQSVGISVSCAARALKGRPDISAETCKRVREAAERLGYSSDPLLTALSAYRQSRKPGKFRETLAFLTARCDEKTWLAGRETGDLLRGARDRAEALGYRLDFLNIGTAKKGHLQAARTLRARGIKGIVLRTFPLTMDQIHLPLDQFASVNLFSEPHSDRISTVSSYHAQSMELALQKLLQRGVRHPALILGQRVSEAIHHGWYMAFRIYSSPFKRASIYSHEDDLDGLWAANQPSRKSRSPLDEWVAKRNPDALLFCTSENHIPGYWLGLAQRNPSEFPQIVCLDLLNPGCGMAGIYQDRYRAGAVAVERLQSFLLASQLGIGRQADALLIPGTWSETAM